MNYFIHSMKSRKKQAMFSEKTSCRTVQGYRHACTHGYEYKIYNKSKNKKDEVV